MPVLFEISRLDLRQSLRVVRIGGKADLIAFCADSAGDFLGRFPLRLHILQHFVHCSDALMVRDPVTPSLFHDLRIAPIRRSVQFQTAGFARTETIDRSIVRHNIPHGFRIQTRVVDVTEPVCSRYRHDRTYEKSDQDQCSKSFPESYMYIFHYCCTSSLS